MSQRGLASFSPEHGETLAGGLWSLILDVRRMPGDEGIRERILAEEGTLRGDRGEGDSDCGDDPVQLRDVRVH